MLKSRFFCKLLRSMRTSLRSIAFCCFLASSASELSSTRTFSKNIRRLRRRFDCEESLHLIKFDDWNPSYSNFDLVPRSEFLGVCSVNCQQELQAMTKWENSFWKMFAGLYETAAPRMGMVFWENGRFYQVFDMLLQCVDRSVAIGQGPFGGTLQADLSFALACRDPWRGNK